MSGYTFEKFIEETNAAKSADEVFTSYQKALQEYGYDSICYCLVTDHPSLGLKANHGAMQNYSDEWVSYYRENNYKSVDPVLKHCFTTTRPFTWNWVSNSPNLPTNEKKLMHEAEDARLLSGIAVPIHGLNGELAAIGLASSIGKTELDQNALSKIRAFSHQFHLAYTEKEELAAQYKDILLSDRERQILMWAAEGKSDQVIADIIGISHSTIRYHLNNIFKKLDANERTFAVVKAIRHGLILPTYVSRF